MATARWTLKHSIYGLMILRLGIYTNRPNVSKLCSPISSMNSSILISVISENKLLASIPCFQKICLLFYEWFMLLNYNISTFEVFLSFSFLFHFYIHKTFLCTSTFLYMTNFFCTRIRTLSLYVTRSIYKPYSKISHFSQHTLIVHTKFSSYTLVAHTHKNSFPRIIYTQKPSIHIFLLHTCIDKNLFLFFMNMTNASFFLLGFLVHFIFRTTFLNENSTWFRNFNKHYWQQRNKYRRNNSNDMYVQNKSQKMKQTLVP